MTRAIATNWENVDGSIIKKPLLLNSEAPYSNGCSVLKPSSRMLAGNVLANVNSQVLDMTNWSRNCRMPSIAQIVMNFRQVLFASSKYSPPDCRTNAKGM